jgi:N-acetyl-gamma-glutamyl-phosphate reductase
MVALDNLGKGMAGQAVQAMNVALGIPEATALWQPARFPN